MRKKYIYASLLVVLAIATGFFLIELKEKKMNNSDHHKEDMMEWISTEHGFIHIKTFTNSSLGDSLNLVCVLHGDAPNNKPGYQYIMAEKTATQNKNTIAVGILRPGYEDPDGNTSNGVRGFAIGDNYTVEAIEAISETIEKLKKLYNPTKVILVGHSGGSAITGDIIGTTTGLIDVAVLVSCPCDVSKWRDYMKEKQYLNPLWSLKVNSISPTDVAKDIDKKTKVFIIVGTEDDITPINLSAEYNDYLRSLDITTDFTLIQDQGHEILLNREVVLKIESILKQ